MLSSKNSAEPSLSMPSLRLVFGCSCGKMPGIGYLYEQSPQRHYHSGALASLGMETFARMAIPAEACRR